MSGDSGDGGDSARGDDDTNATVPLSPDAEKALEMPVFMHVVLVLVLIVLSVLMIVNKTAAMVLTTVVVTVLFMIFIVKLNAILEQKDQLLIGLVTMSANGQQGVPSISGSLDLEAGGGGGPPYPPDPGPPNYEEAMKAKAADVEWADKKQPPPYDTAIKMMPDVV